MGHSFTPSQTWLIYQASQSWIEPASMQKPSRCKYLQSANIEYRIDRFSGLSGTYPFLDSYL